ncbi:hypothetical protein A33Q_1880 [Indibacter alkaliphilus LW1]|uniref:Uncharacterized protein n=1 Tax=Indibacter alkaliphilus (strain CCUG 57479 / KCTC 22604 / LW1) TaxID=1189612 RepID=S2DCQ9_INDAL|nr:hypothetical protein A33Q_1880 [Indibacter alkaliphilus LW1]
MPLKLYPNFGAMAESLLILIGYIRLYPINPADLPLKPLLYKIRHLFHLSH